MGLARLSLGQREEALAVTEEAAELCRRLAAANPAAFEPDLAKSLANLGLIPVESGTTREGVGRH